MSRAAKILSFVLLAATAAMSAVAADTTVEEITVNFDVPRLASRDISAHFDGATVYLPMGQVFAILDVNVEADPVHARVQGFFLTKDRRYELRPNDLKAIIKGAEVDLPPSSFQYDGVELYLRIDQFKRLFGLNMVFDFSMLRVQLSLNEQFPAYQRLKRKQAREKLEKTEAALRNVKVIPLRREIFSGGVIDWTLSATPKGGNGQYADIALGSMLMGGDLSISGTGNTITGVSPKDITGRWHYALNPNPYVSQVEVGSINSGGLLNRSLRGAMLTNRPQAQRTFFQTINLSGRLDPGWEVELYADGRLIDFAEADQSGTYHFNVDIAYGSSDLELKMYGPNGEIRTETKHVSVPYTLVPKGQMEYTGTVGSDQLTSDNRWYSQATAYYGVMNGITVGLGADAPLSGQTLGATERPLVSGEATARLVGSAVANASIAPGYRSMLGLNYTMPSSISADLTFTAFAENKFRNPIGQRSSASLAFSSPLRLWGRYVGLRFNAQRDAYNTFINSSMNYGFNAAVWRLYCNYLGRYAATEYPGRVTRQITSQLLLSTDILPWLRPQLRFNYDHATGRLSRAGVYVTRRFLRTGQLSLSYENNPIAGTNTVMLGINFFTGAANFSTRGQYTGGEIAVNQVQHGSIRYDRSAGKIRFDRRSGIGYGSAVIRPFLDTDNDGIAGKNDEILPGLRARISGVGGRPNARGRMFYYDGLRPYDSYTIQVDATTLDNPLLKPAYENFKVAVNPNVVTVVDVPVVMAAEINGVVERLTAGGKVGVGGILLHIVNVSKDIVTDITTFSSGQYSSLGLIPGKYRAYLDESQLSQYGYAAEPASIEFEVQPSTTPQSVDNINFVLKAK